MSLAIVGLTRTFPDRRRYDEVISRNRSIEKFIGTSHPVIIFHEGNLPSSDMDYIKQNSPNL